jgi:NADH dehydrogenase [ubiquinone] 1 alpha subcomplex assembly factor 1
MIIALNFQLILLQIMPQSEETITKNIIADFTDNSVRAKWGVTNDGVMGGVSTSQISISENNCLLFSGEVSLENNGGFASLRSPLGDYDFSNYEGFLVKVKGDGKTYSLSFRQTKYFTGYNYNLRFETEENNWQVIKLPFKYFKLKYYGREVSDFNLPDTKEIKQLSILISDKQQGPFKLEIEWIKLY